MKARNKKLARLIGMALSVGVVVGMNPMQADAKVSVTYDPKKDNYTVECNIENDTLLSWPECNKDKVLAAINAALSKDSDSISFINISGFSGDGEADLLATLTDVKIPAGKGVYLTTSNGTYGVVTTDNSDATVARTGDKNFTVSNNVDTVYADGDAQITVANGATVDYLSVKNGNVTVNSAENNDKTVNSVSVIGTSIISGTVFTKNTSLNIGSAAVIADSATVTISGGTEVGNIRGNGNVIVSNGTVNTGSITSNGTIQVAESATLNTGAISNVTNISGGGTINAGTSDINLGSTGSLTAGTVTAKSITAKTVEVTNLANNTDVNADTLTFTTETTVGSGSGTYTVGSLKTSEGGLFIEDPSKLSGTTSLEAKENLSVYGDVSGVTTLTAGQALVVGKGGKVNENADLSAFILLNNSDSPLEVKSIDTTILNVGDQNITVTDTLKVNGNVLNASSSTIQVGTVELGANTWIEGNTAATIVTDNLVVDGTMDNAASRLAGLTLRSATNGGEVTVTIKGGTEETRAAIIQSLEKQNDGNVNITVTDGDADDDTDDKTDADEVIAAAEEKIASTDKELEKISKFATADTDALAAADPFVTQLPSTDDIAAIAGVSAETLQSMDAALKESYDAIVDMIAGTKDKDQIAQLEAERDKLQAKREAISVEGMQKQAAKLVSATQQAGKTAAAPGISSVRTAGAEEIMTGNVVARTAELRSAATAVDDGRPAPDNIWFQYKHTNTELGGGSVYSKSTINSSNYQLGYDTKIGDNDYLGVYIGTTTGSVEYTGLVRSGVSDIENAYDLGIYGTHLLPKDQYIDYMIHTGRFDNKYNGQSWGTRDTGAMIGCGAKIAESDRLTWNPYVQLSYDRVSVDDYLVGKNRISSDSSNNWMAKLGINLIDSSGFYGGLAYSRGLSGGYNAYINGIAMPTEDFNANVMYLSLGYRASLSQKVFLDVSAEKTFGDYKGWTATGKVNFYF